MPIVIVYGIPDGVKEELVVNFFVDILEEMTGIKELGLEKSQITVFSPKDRMEIGLGEDIIIFVEGLFEKPERTTEVINLLAKKLVNAAETNFPETKVIECFIRTVNPQVGFYSSVDKVKEGQ